MIKSSKPRIQRLFRYTAPMHIRQKFAHSHVDKALRKKLNLPRAIQISKGDTVKIDAGKFKGKTGVVSAVDLKTSRIFINGIVRKNSKGKEKGIPISASNVSIIDINLNDKVRATKLKQSQKIEKEKDIKSTPKIENKENNKNNEIKEINNKNDINNIKM
ncbi:MAG: 50S ribosomal protein L24 [Candidatus Micrarchaeia archaeon]